MDDGVRKDVDVYRLDQVRVEAGLAGATPVCVLAVAGERDDARAARQFRELAQPSRQLVVGFRCARALIRSGAPGKVPFTISGNLRRAAPGRPDSEEKDHG